MQLPGTSALRVALDRQHVPGRQPIVRGAMGDWDLNTPRIEGSFAAVEGFVPSSGSAANRCTGFWRPPPASRPSAGSRAMQDFQPDEYWHGTNLVVPGHGSQETLTRENLPEAGEEWRLVTRGLWKLSCLTQLQNAPGEGFLARSPEGVTYRFDWMASRETTPLQKGGALLTRHDVFLMATRVQDRFGNWVEYRYDANAPMNLLEITAGTQQEGSAGDPRRITLGYLNGRVNWVRDQQLRTWTYQYDSQGALRHVTLPDASRWTFSLGSLVQIPGLIINEQTTRCDTIPAPASLGPLSGWMEHPSGATVEFRTDFVVHGRTNVPRFCTFLPGFRITNGSVFPHTTVSQTLLSKRITGPGMVPMVWEYFSGNVGAFATCDTCPDSKVVTVKEPRGHVTRYTYGIGWRANDGQLLRVEHADAAGNLVRSQNIRYRVPNGEFPDRFGNSVRFTTDLMSTLNRPEDRRETFQQGQTFLWEVEGTGSSAFDQFARPLVTRVSSDLDSAYERRERRVWRDFPALWVMGQLQSVSVLEPQRTLVVEETRFYPQTALPEQHSSFGRVLRTMSYHPNGLLWELRDGAGNPTRFENYKLGQPQLARFADNTSARQTINALGNAQDFTNEAGQSMSFGFDAMGRVNRVSYPPEPGLAYHDTTITLQQSALPSRGLPAGHWRQTVQTENAVTERWLDALWRVRLELRRDIASPATTGRAVETRYDAAGNKVFESYPQRDIAQVDGVHPGTSHSYDSLQRLERTEASSELGSLVTSVSYLSGFRKQVTNPRGLSTTYHFQAFDQPSEDSISLLELPEGVEVQFVRDVFGKPRFINRYGPSSSGPTAVTRAYTYNEHQQLCKTVEPESGATVQGYDGAGNVSWRATGRPASSSCNLTDQPVGRLTQFTHDARNRLRLTSFGDGSPQIHRSYTPDGLLDQISSGPTQWNYVYNNRRILTRETLSTQGRSLSFNWGIDAYGNRSSMTYPTGTPLAFVPNALGQPQRLTSGHFLLASGLSYHPNGALHTYTLSNGVQYTQQQNVRGLPWTWRHQLIAAGEVAENLVDHTYTYDRVGNVVSILDGALPSQTRGMAYDGLDRLRLATGPWGDADYRYDAVDNLRYSRVGARELTHHYDASNRLVGVSGTHNASLSYDLNGNVRVRDGRLFNFDLGNRLGSSGGMTFAYDGHGRRTSVTYVAPDAAPNGGSSRLQMYSRDGKLLYGEQRAEGAQAPHEQLLYVHLQDRLVAEFNAAKDSLHNPACDAR